jgi:CheY-like chemotaxis protein
MTWGRTILVAEDTEDDALLLERALQRVGLQNPVQIVTDGEELLDYLRGDGRYADREVYPLPRILFTDLKMPRVDGFEVLKWVQKNPEFAVVPTIVFSNSSDPQDIQRAYQLGAHAYRVKPADVSRLEEMLRVTYEFWATCAKPPVVSKTGDGCFEGASNSTIQSPS